ncbi:peptide ABC transporter substrate-binding protein [Phreatobacter sp.]|uniref:peptide ABC transporter substrate-binding protein n=1 Tax=Phreatobacter sp. TaxID=1966341 RepID=UPI003F721E0C
MNEHDIRGMAHEVKEGRLSRRSFMSRMVAAGLTAPMAWHILDFHGVARAQAAFTYKPTKAGGGGPLKLLFWQAPTLINPHFAVGTKDQEASRIFYEPLAAWDPEGNLVAVLAAEIPSRENGGLSADGKQVTWKIKPTAKWHDGQPVTADDALFTWQYARDPATAAVTIGSYKDVQVEKIDNLTVRVTFSKATPFWADAFVGIAGCLLPKHHFGDYMGAKSREAPANLKPVGTGPFKYADFKPGDIVRGDRNTDYHEPNRPYFDTIEMKGGGDAVSAARAVLQTGEYDYSWNLQVEDEILKRLETGGRGRATIVDGANIEHIQLNATDPWNEVEGERASVKSKHPAFSEKAVREAVSLLIDRGSVERFIYGRTGLATANFLNNPPRVRSPNTKWEFNIEKANQILEAAGWKRGSDGIRAKDGKKLKFVFQTSINAPRQKTQAIIKQAAQRAGVDIELKSVTASVYFSSDVANPDTYTKFFCDMQMYTTTMTQPDPERFMNQFCSWEIATKENKWQGRNIPRWQSAEYDKTFRDAEGELDPAKRAAMFIKMNDLVIADFHVIGVVYRPRVAGLKTGVVSRLTGWDNELWRVADWYRE